MLTDYSPPPDAVIRWCADPRPDLHADSPQWGQLLSVAWDATDGDPSGPFGPLHGLRCCGAALIRDARARWTISAGAMDAATYAADRMTWLAPHAREVSELLRRLELATPADISQQQRRR